MWHIEIDVALPVRHKKGVQGFYQGPPKEEYYFGGVQTFIIVRVPWGMGRIPEEYYEPFLEEDDASVPGVWLGYGLRVCERMNRENPVKHRKKWGIPSLLARWSNSCST